MQEWQGLTCCAEKFFIGVVSSGTEGELLKITGMDQDTPPDHYHSCTAIANPCASCPLVEFAFNRSCIAA